MKLKAIANVVLLLLISFTLNTAFGQDVFSTNTKMLLLHVNNSLKKSTGFSDLQLPAEAERSFAVNTVENEKLIHGFISVEPGFDTRQLKNLGIGISTNVNGLLSASIPLKSILQLQNITGIKYVDVDRRASFKLDSSRILTKTALVQAGTGLPKAFNGQGVIIGVIDGGFDYTHPTFKDGDGNLRISRVWDQAKSGTPPAGFTYGVEYKTVAEILAAQSDGTDTHGSHVAGIAGGSGNGSGAAYIGMAPGAEFVFVSSGGGSSTIADGIKYIFDYAKSVNKPAVINMSLGFHIGPHDGTSALDQNIDNMIGPGKIIVGAAGNEGDTKLHLYRDFISNPSPISTVIGIENPANGYGQIDLWGSAGSNFSISISIIDQAGNVQHTSEVIPASSNRTLENNVPVGTETLAYKISAKGVVPANNKPNIQIEVSNKSSQYFIVLNCSSTNSKVHFWNNGTNNGAAFDKIDKPGYIEGDIHCTVGEIGGTAKGIISVGAYTSKNQYRSIDGVIRNAGFYTENGALAPFSSQGPTADGRVKPEITAPGNVVVSAGNSFKPNQNIETTVLKADNKWPYIISQGTSMATPCAAGIIALLLQAKPNLTRGNIVDFFKSKSIIDIFTGIFPVSGSNKWGFGKIDAYECIKLALNSTNTAPNANVVSYYPNPAISGQPVTFKSIATDSDEDSIRIKYDWGDGDSTNYNEYYKSGVEVSTTHIFKTAGSFTIKEEAMDEHGLEGEWSQPFTVDVIAGAQNFDIKGNVIYSNTSSTPLNNVKVYLSKNSTVVDSAVTNQSGNFTFSNKEKGTYTISCACTQQWGGVNSTDALVIRRFLAGISNLDALQTLSADVNKSGSVNSTDALLIRKRVAGIDNTFSAGDWVFDNPSVVNETGVTITIKGLCTGDVNGSFVPGAAAKVSAIPVIKSGTAKISGVNEITLPVSFNTDAVINALTLSFSISSGNYELIGVESKLAGLICSLKDNNLLLAWDDLNPVSVSAKEEIIRIKLRTVNSDNQLSERLIFNGGEVADINGNRIENLAINIPEIRTNVPTAFSLGQNYPNPFNPETVINYSLPVDCAVRIEVYNSLGARIKELVNERKTAGNYNIKFRAENISSGVYFYSIKANGNDGKTDFNAVKKLLLLK